MLPISPKPASPAPPNRERGTKRMERYEDLNLWMKSSTAQIKKNLPGFTAKELYNKYYPDELQLKANTKEKQKLKNFKEQLKRQ